MGHKLSHQSHNFPYTIYLREVKNDPHIKDIFTKQGKGY